MGERGLAEEIALAAVEKSMGEKSDVTYLLHELMLHANDQESLTNRVTELLERDNTNVEGKQELIDQISGFHADGEKKQRPQGRREWG